MPAAKKEGSGAEPATITFIFEEPALGLALTNRAGGGVVVKHIIPGSPAAQRNMPTGLTLLEVNGVSCLEFDFEAASQLIKDATRPVTVVLEAPRAEKPTSKFTRKLSFGRDRPSSGRSKEQAPVDDVAFRAEAKFRELQEQLETAEAEAAAKAAAAARAHEQSIASQDAVSQLEVQAMEAEAEAAKAEEEEMAAQRRAI